MKKIKKFWSVAIVAVFLLNSVPYPAYGMKMLHPRVRSQDREFNSSILDIIMEMRKIPEEQRHFARLLFTNLLLQKQNEEKGFGELSFSKLFRKRMDEGKISIFDIDEIAILSIELAEIKDDFSIENIEKIVRTTKVRDKMVRKPKKEDIFTIEDKKIKEIARLIQLTPRGSVGVKMAKEAKPPVMVFAGNVTVRERPDGLNLESFLAGGFDGAILGDLKERVILTKELAAVTSSGVMVGAIAQSKTVSIHDLMDDQNKNEVNKIIEAVVEKVKPRVNQIIRDRNVALLNARVKNIVNWVGGSVGEISSQLDEQFKDITKEQLKNSVIYIAAKPKNAETGTVGATHDLIYNWFQAKYGKEIAQSIQILYAGEMNRDSIDEIMAIPPVHGVFIDASKKTSEDVLAIVEGVDRAANRDGRNYTCIISSPADTSPGDFIKKIQIATYESRIDPERTNLVFTAPDVRLEKWQEAVAKMEEEEKELEERLSSLMVKLEKGRGLKRVPEEIRKVMPDDFAWGKRFLSDIAAEITNQAYLSSHDFDKVQGWMGLIYEELRRRGKSEEHKITRILYEKGLALAEEWHRYGIEKKRKNLHLLLTANARETAEVEPATTAKLPFSAQEFSGKAEFVDADVIFTKERQLKLGVKRFFINLSKNLLPTKEAIIYIVAPTEELVERYKEMWNSYGLERYPFCKVIGPEEAAMKISVYHLRDPKSVRGLVTEQRYSGERESWEAGIPERQRTVIHIAGENRMQLILPALWGDLDLLVYGELSPEWRNYFAKTLIENGVEEAEKIADEIESMVKKYGKSKSWTIAVPLANYQKRQDVQREALELEELLKKMG